MFWLVSKVIPFDPLPIQSFIHSFIHSFLFISHSNIPTEAWAADEVNHIYIYVCVCVCVCAHLCPHAHLCVPCLAVCVCICTTAIIASNMATLFFSRPYPSTSQTVGTHLFCGFLVYICAYFPVMFDFPLLLAGAHLTSAVSWVSSGLALGSCGQTASLLCPALRTEPPRSSRRHVLTHLS